MGKPIAPTHRTLLRRYLLAAYLLLIVYASLTPFSGWQEQGFEFREVFESALRQTYKPFDALINFIAYLPLGFLLALTLRGHTDVARSLLFSSLLATLLSVGLEYLQMYLPNRISSNADILTNSAGGLIGALTALAIMPRVWFARLTQQRIEMFQSGGDVDFGLALVLLWMFAQINPSLPMLGNVFITEAAHRIFSAMPDEPFDTLMCIAVALNLLMMGLLLQTLLQVRRNATLALLLILCLVALAKFIAAAALLKSWALLLWLNSEAMLGIVAGLLMLWGISLLRLPSVLWIAGGGTCAYLALALWELDSSMPSAAMRLYYWRFGHLRNYNGMSQWVSVLFPLLFGMYLFWAHKRLNRQRSEQ